ncbi:MAG: glycoside hydrolase family 9 protein [Oscillospiraceae bacterium]|nr:glycoside hydrolase family 9 protein [Oscillospiraceae bacterium]
MFPSNAAYINEEEPNNYDNFAEALQLAMCFYDANKCGDEVGEDGYYSWRGDCHVKDAEIPLKPMNPMPELYGEAANDGSENGKDPDDTEDPPKGEGDGDGGASSAEGLYEGVNMSQEFIDENRQWLDPDGNGTLDLTGGWHDAGDHVKFGLPGSYSASTIGWGYYEFREDYIDMGLQTHIEDELRWINDYFMKATFLDDKDNVVGYCYQVGEGNNDHNYWCAPELQVDDTVVATASCAVKRPAYFATTEMPAPDQCAGASASLAINYLNFKDTDPEYAAESLKYARALYEFAVATHKESWTPGSTPSSLVLGYDGGFYHSSYDYDELAWAAVWLYYAAVAEDETQKDAAYDKYIEAIIAVDETTTNAKGAHPYTGYMKRIITDTGNCWQNIWVHCWDTVWGGVFAKLAPVTNTARDWYIFRYNLEYWSGCAKTVDSSKWGYEPVHGHKYFGMDDFLWNTPMTCDEIPDLPESETSGDFIAKSPYGWAVVSGYGSARYNTAAGLCAGVYAKTTGDETFMPWAKAQMEYILGNNPMGYAYEVGYGNSYASQPHHRAAHCSATQSMEDPIKQVHTLWGALVGGPDLDDFHSDVTKDYIYNEVTDDYNAGFLGDLAGLYHFYGAEGKELADKNHINPDFNMSENAYADYDQVDADGNPLPTGLFISGGKAQLTDASVQVKVIVHNRTINPPRFESNLKARYYFNISEQMAIGEDISFIHTETDYDAESGYTSGKNHATISEPVKYDDNGTYYVEISWQNCDFYGSRIYQFRIVNDMNPETYDTVFDPDNDYSYQDLISFEDDNAAEIITDKITLYADDELVWGVEPPKEGDSTETTEPTKPSATVPAATDEELLESALWGDVNVDGSVSIADVVKLNLYLLNNVDNALTEQGFVNANCLYDGVVDSSDSTLLMNYAAMIIHYTELGPQS